MRFGRSLLCWFLLVSVLAGGLVATRLLRPKARILPGERLFPLDPEAVVEISLASGQNDAPAITLVRDGEFWRMTAPYAGALCDSAAVSRLLDAAQSLRVLTPLEAGSVGNWTPWRLLSLKTPDRTVACGLGLPPNAPDAAGRASFNLSQALAVTRGHLVSVEASALARLPATPAELRTKALLPVVPARLESLEWRAPGRPFTRAQRLPNAHWNVTRPFPFEPKSQPVEAALTALTAPAVITAYIQPADSQPLAAATPVDLTSEAALAAYGLDEERALRLTAHARGLRTSVTLRFGKEDPKAPGTVFCLLDGYRAIVTVPKAIPDLFGSGGPFATDFRNLPVLGDVPVPGVLSLRVAPSDAPVSLLKRSGAWQMERPFKLPADTAILSAFTASMTALTGDLVGVDPPPLVPLAEVTLAPDADEPTRGAATLVFYPTQSEEHLYAYRQDQGRLYRLARKALPELLLKPTPERALLDRTLLALPAATIRRIAILRRDGTQTAIARAADTLSWELQSPKGDYIDNAALDAWLTALADLKAERILRDAPTALSALQPYGLDTPALRITIDLDGQGDALRRVLSIGTEHPETHLSPALIQGRPVLYEIDAETRALLERPLTKRE